MSERMSHEELAAMAASRHGGYEPAKVRELAAAYIEQRTARIAAEERANNADARFFNLLRTYRVLQTSAPQLAISITEPANSPEPSDPPPLAFTYRNHAGIIVERRVQPIAFVYGAMVYNTEPQWMLFAMDMDMGGLRGFAVKDIGISAEIIAKLRAEGFKEGRIEP